MEISESNGFSCCCLVSLPASYEKQHYQGYKYNQTTKVLQYKQWQRESIFFSFYFFFVSNGLILLFEMSIVTVTLIFDTYIQGMLFLANFHVQKINMLENKMHFREENWQFEKILMGSTFTSNIPIVCIFMRVVYSKKSERNRGCSIYIYIYIHIYISFVCCLS